MTDPDDVTRLRIRSVLGLGLALGLLCSASDRAHAESQQDKSGYTLVNPTPPDQLRSFNTDRPTKENVPYTIDAGHYQLEADLAFFTRDQFNKARVKQTTWNGFAPILKAGLTDSLQ